MCVTASSLQKLLECHIRFEYKWYALLHSASFSLAAAKRHFARINVTAWYAYLTDARWPAL